jgi:signal transduction histidine kinase
LRTPLTIVKWTAGNFLNNDNKNITDEERALLRQIFTGNERMIKLVNDLLNVSRIETGKQIIIVRKQADIMTSVIGQAVNGQLKVAEEKGVTINLPPHKHPPISMDPEKMGIVFENLLNNAIKYSKKGGRIEMGCKTDENNIIISIKDAGIGIPQAQQPMIFKKFFRGTNVGTEELGTGLGLYIAKAIVEAHGGKIWFKSKLNKGTTFFVSLPLKIKK